MKLFYNLSSLAEEVVYSFILFIALAAILINGAERFEHFWYKVTYVTCMCNYFKIHPLVKDEKSCKCFFSIFSSGGHLVQRSETV